MAITAYSTGTSTELNANTIDIKSDITQDDMLFWNANTNLFESATPTTRLLSNYATQQFVQQEIANTVSSGTVSLTGYATETYVQNQIAALGSIFDGDYNSLTNLPTLFNGDYNSLTNLPSLFSGDYNDLINKPVLSSYYQTMTFVGTELTLSNGNTVDLAALAGSNTAIDDLNDVDTTAVTVGQGLRWNGTQWVPHTFQEFDGDYANLTNLPTIPNDLLDLNINDGTAGQVLTTNGAGNFYFSTVSGGGGGGLGYTDFSVTTGTASAGGSLLYSNTNGTFTFRPANLTGYATQTWVTTQLGSYALASTVPTDVSDLTDTTNLLSGGGGGGGIALTDLSVTQNAGSGTGTLAYNSTTGVFTYTPPDLSGYSTFDGDYNNLTNTPTIPTDVSDLTDTTNLLSGGGGGATALDDLSDVDISTVAPTVGQFLMWDGTQWEPGTAGGGGGGASPIGWTTAGTDNEYRLSSTFTELGDQYTVRSVSINSDNLLQIELATFSPTVSATGQSLYWDQPATQFSVSVDNPTDFTARYIDEVAMISAATGVHTTLSDYTAGAKSNTPAGGVDWTQTFSTNATATIVSNSNNLTGGSAGATITFYEDDGSAWTTTDTISYTWQSANATVSFANLTGQNFLGKYNTVGYTVSITGLNDSANATTTLTPTGGTLSNSGGSGTMTFTDALHKDNNTGREIALSTDFSRPAGVTGSAYTATDTASDTSISASFTYPSFYYWTADTATAPTRADIVDGSDFDASVTELGNQSKSIATTITNSDASARAFWFGIRTSATQPTVFETGPSSSLLSTVSVTTGNTVNLEPDTPETGYVAEGYTLYGITLQPGDTYVRIN